MAPWPVREPYLEPTIPQSGKTDFRLDDHAPVLVRLHRLAAPRAADKQFRPRGRHCQPARWAKTRCTRCLELWWVWVLRRWFLFSDPVRILRWTWLDLHKLQ